MFQNNDYIKTILLKAFQIFRLLSSAPTNGKCEHRLKLEKVSNFFKFFKVARSYLYAC